MMQMSEIHAEALAEDGDRNARAFDKIQKIYNDSHRRGELPGLRVYDREKAYVEALAEQGRRIAIAAAEDSSRGHAFIGAVVVGHTYRGALDLLHAEALDTAPIITVHVDRVNAKLAAAGLAARVSPRSVRAAGMRPA